MPPRTTSNVTVNGGSCGFYGTPATSTARSCFDCLSYVVAREPQGCMVNEYGLCASMTSYNLALDFRCVNNGSTTSSTSLFQFPAANVTYCDTSMMTSWCTKCLALNSYDGFCNFGTCLCIGKCEFEPPVTTAPPVACREEELCTLSSKIISGVLIGLVALSVLVCYCCRCWLAVGARHLTRAMAQSATGQNGQQQSISLQQLEQLRDRLLLHGQPTNEARQVVSDGEGHMTVSGVKYYVLPEPPGQVPQQYYYDGVERDEQYPYKVD